MSKFLEQIRKQDATFLLGIFVIILCFAYLGAITFFRVPDINSVSEIKMAVISVLTLVVGYHFGSSKGSKDKDSTIKDLAEGTTKVENVNSENTTIN